MANNELSGPLIISELIKHYSQIKPYKTIRFVVHPETIGAISYINKNFKKLKSNVIGGYVLTCLGDDKNYSLISSNYGDSISDKSAKKALEDLSVKYKLFDFTKRGSDERQYNSPLVDLKLCSLCRTKHGMFKQYHTSKDDFKFVTSKGLMGGYYYAFNSVEILTKNFIPINKITCEPFLSKRKMYPTINHINNNNTDVFKILNFLDYSDGKNDLIDISNILNLTFKETFKIAEQLLSIKIIKKYKIKTKLY